MPISSWCHGWKSRMQLALCSTSQPLHFRNPPCHLIMNICFDEASWSNRSTATSLSIDRDLNACVLELFLGCVGIVWFDHQPRFAWIWKVPKLRACQLELIAPATKKGQCPTCWSIISIPRLCHSLPDSVNHWECGYCIHWHSKGVPSGWFLLVIECAHPQRKAWLHCSMCWWALGPGWCRGCGYTLKLLGESASWRHFSCPQAGLLLFCHPRTSISSHGFLPHVSNCDQFLKRMSNGFVITTSVLRRMLC